MIHDQTLHQFWAVLLGVFQGVANYVVVACEESAKQDPHQH